MALPAAVSQTIERIIASTEDVTDELQSAMAQELEEQYEEFVRQAVAAKIPYSQAAELQLILNQPQFDTQQLQQFLNQLQINFNSILDQAHTRLQQYYLGS